MKRNSLIPLPLDIFLKNIYSNVLLNKSGKTADYIPELSRANPDQFGVALASSDGYIHEIGDSLQEFTIQSISKAFAYSLALELVGEKEVNKIIGVEPSGEAFNSIRFQNDNRPFNPMINAGAIACTALICSVEKSKAFKKIQKIMSDFAGRNLSLDEKVFKSENATGDRNRAIAWLLKNNKIIKTNVEQSLVTYFKQCSLLVSARDLATMGATLACNGINPVTKKRVISVENALKTMSIMVSSGMYDYSGEWVYRVGFPAKSGVGGGIIAALPSQFGLGTFSPPLDRQGNSVRGIEVCKRISSYYNLHILEIEGNIKDSIVASYNLQNIRSSTERKEKNIKILEKFGAKAHVYELAGSINFMAVDYIVRRLQELDKKEFIILSMRKVSQLSSGADKLLDAFIQTLNSLSTKIIFSDIEFNSQTWNKIFGSLGNMDDNKTRLFENNNEAIRWVEDFLIQKYSTDEKVNKNENLKEQFLFKALSNSDLDFLKERMIEKKFKKNVKIISKGDEADGIYFLQSGKVDIAINVQKSLTTLNAGTCFGEFALIEPKSKRSANVTTLTECTCFYLPLKILDSIQQSRKKIIETLLKNLALLLIKRLKDCNSKINNILDR